jgi:hypothetical protein
VFEFVAAVKLLDFMALTEGQPIIVIVIAGGAIVQKSAERCRCRCDADRRMRNAVVTSRLVEHDAVVSKAAGGRIAFSVQQRPGRRQPKGRGVFVVAVAELRRAVDDQRIPTGLDRGPQQRYGTAVLDVAAGSATHQADLDHLPVEFGFDVHGVDAIIVVDGDEIRGVIDVQRVRQPLEVDFLAGVGAHPTSVDGA